MSYLIPLIISSVLIIFSILVLLGFIHCKGFPDLHLEDRSLKHFIKCVLIGLVFGLYICVIIFLPSTLWLWCVLNL